MSSTPARLNLIALVSALLAPAALGAPGFQAEAGVTYFRLHHGHFEAGPPPAATREDAKAAPYLAAAYGFSERFGLRLSYHALNDVRATTVLLSPSGAPALPPIEVQGHYYDDVHVLGLAPEFSFRAAPRLGVTLAPQLNWVSSRGVVSYASTSPFILLLGPRPRRETGFTLGGGLRLEWQLNQRATLSAGYHSLDLDPSFARRAHAFSAGAGWKF